MKTSDHKLIFTSYLVNQQNPEFGNVIYLQGKKNEANGEIVIPPENVLDALLASSAFPFAFGQKHLDYCMPLKDVTDGRFRMKSRVCPDEYVEADSFFVDGGVFDNVPLGTAKALGEPWLGDPKTKDAPKKSRRTTYLFMDPGHLRPGSLSESQRPNLVEKPTYGLLGEANFLNGALATGTTYELYKQLTGGDWNHQIEKMTNKIFGALIAEPKYLDEKSLPPGKTPYQIFIDANTRKPYSSSLIGAIIASLKVWQDEYECELSSFEGGCGKGPRASPDSLSTRREEQIAKLDSIANKLGRTDINSFVYSGKYDPRGDRRIFLSSRFSPLTGNYLWHFGAFIDVDFRKFDYYAGIFDAVENLAELQCSTTVTANKECLPDAVRSIYDLLQIESDPDATTVFGVLGNKEFGWPLPKSNARETPNIRIIAETFTSDQWKECPDFITFIHAIKQSGYNAESSEILQDLFEMKSNKEIEFLFPIIRPLITRLEDMESAEKKINKKADGLHTVVIFGGLFSKTLIGDDGSFRWNQGFADSTLLNILLPYEVSADIRNGGFNLSWEPRIPFSPGWSFNPKITGVGLDKFGHELLYYSQLDVYLVHHLDNFVFSSFGIGPLANLTWEQWQGYPRLNEGVSGFVGLLGDKLRVTAGSRSFRDTFLGNNIFVTLGITDFQGISESIFKSLFK